MMMNRRIRTFLGSLLILALLCAVPALAAETGDGTEKPQQTIETADSYTCVKGDKAFVLKALVTSGEPAARGALSFRSDRTDVASVDSNGRVTIKAVGTARIFVTAAETDAFRETTVEVTVKVNPKGTSIKSVKALASRMLFVKIKKSSAASGYELRYATNSNMKRATRLKLIGKSYSNKAIWNLKAGKKYYFQVRTYKKADGVEYYSTWSKTKSAKARKRRKGY